MTQVYLFRKEIEDEWTQENFKRIQDFINGFPLNKGEFKFIKIQTPGPVTNYKVPHKLGFVPMDVIETHVNGGTVTWHYSLFDRTNLNISTSAATVIRAFVGRYEE